MQTVVHEPVVVCTCYNRGRLARLYGDMTEVLWRVRAQLTVISHVRPRCACRMCEGVEIDRATIGFADACDGVRG